MPENLSLRRPRAGRVIPEAWEALDAAEAELASAASAFERSQNQLALAARKYSAVRDVIQEAVGVNPHALRAIKLAKSVATGRFRFVNTKIGDAITEVLIDAGAVPNTALDPPGAMDLYQISDALNRGGFNYPEKVNVRSVNAALLRLAGIERIQREKGGDLFRILGRCGPDLEPELDFGDGGGMNEQV